MVTIATVCQLKVSLMLLLDGLCNGAKTISIPLKEKKFIPEWKTTLNESLGVKGRKHMFLLNFLTTKEASSIVS